MKSSTTRADADAAQRITDHIAALGGWRGPMLAQLRQLIRAAGPDLTEAWKWNTPVWSQQGLVVAVGAFKEHLKINFFQGAALSDPKGLFNAGLDAKTMRSIDLHEGDKINAAALKALVRAAIAHNAASKRQ